MLRIVGDVCLTDGYFDVGFGIGSKMKRGLNPYQNIKISSSDCWIGNFEGVASDKTDNKTSSLHFCTSPNDIAHFEHFNIYGCANNHIMQHGEDAYHTTIASLKALGCKTFGSNAQKTLIFSHQGRKISISGFSLRIDSFSSTPCYWYNPEYIDIEKELESIPNDAYKIAYVHWGNEFINRPSSQQKHFAHWLIDSGFDLVIGMHPHLLQGYEIYKDKHIFYSLGNFVFNMPWEPTKYGAIVNVDLSKENIVPTVDYVKITESFFPTIVKIEDVPYPYRFETLNALLHKDDNSEEYHAEINRYYKQYRRYNRKNILKNMCLHPQIILGVIKDFIKRRILR